MNIQTLWEAWKDSGANSGNSPATEEAIQVAEAKIGARIPSPLRDIYRLFNGGWALNMDFYPLEPPPDRDLGVTTANEKYIEWYWVIPAEIRLFADNGAEEAFGVWLPACGNPIFNHPIIEVGELPDEEGCMGIAGTNLLSFLRGWSAYYLMGQDLGESKETTFLDRLEVPQSLRSEHFDDSQYDQPHTGEDVHFTQLRKWADPLLPDPAGDSYSQQYTIVDLRRIFGVGE